MQFIAESASDFVEALRTQAGSVSDRNSDWRVVLLKTARGFNCRLCAAFSRQWNIH
jgi:hypothetical protein